MDVTKVMLKLLSEESERLRRSLAAPVTHNATVARLSSDGTAWVVVDGGEGETPATSLVACKTGDRVTCVIEGNRARVTGNVTTPPTGDAVAYEAANDARVARESAQDAAVAASNAQESADSAQQEAERAHGAADAAQQDADAAHVAAQQAQADADAAGIAAGQAQVSADVANRAANDALTQLSVVEDVSGTLSWIAEHGSYVPTSDASVAEGRAYFELDASTGDYVPVAVPDGDPSAQGWYVLDVTDSQSEYIMSHLAVTSAGLWVLPSGIGSAGSARCAAGYKLLLASDGAYLYDSSGHLVMTYGESIDMDSSRPQYIGGEDAYIVYYDSDSDGVADSIRIGGTRVTIGGSSLSQVLADVARARESASAAVDICTIALTSTNGLVFKNDRGVSTTIIATLFTGDGQRIETASQLTARYGAGAYLQWRWKDTGASDFVTLLSTDPRIGAGGFALTVGPNDISTQAVIDCQLVY